MAEGGMVEMSEEGVKVEEKDKIPDCAKQKVEITNLMKKALKKGEIWCV